MNPSQSSNLAPTSISLLLPGSGLAPVGCPTIGPMATGMCDFNQTLQAMAIPPTAIGAVGITGVTGATGTVSAQLVTRFNRVCLTSSSSFTVGVTGSSTYGGSWVPGGCGALTGRVDPVTDAVTGVTVTPLLSGGWPLQAQPCVGQGSQTRWTYTLTGASLASLSCGTYRVSVSE
jgi:hypothetical protein